MKNSENELEKRLFSDREVTVLTLFPSSEWNPFSPPKLNVVPRPWLTGFNNFSDWFDTLSAPTVRLSTLRFASQFCLVKDSLCSRYLGTWLSTGKIFSMVEVIGVLHAASGKEKNVSFQFLIKTRKIYYSNENFWNIRDEHKIKCFSWNIRIIKHKIKWKFMKNIVVLRWTKGS